MAGRGSNVPTMRWLRRRTATPRVRLLELGPTGIDTVEVHEFGDRLLVTSTWPPRWGWTTEAAAATPASIGRQVRTGLDASTNDVVDTFSVHTTTRTQKFLRDHLHVDSVREYRPSVRLIVQRFSPDAMTTLIQFEAEWLDLLERFPGGCIRVCQYRNGRMQQDDFDFLDAGAELDALGEWILHALHTARSTTPPASVATPPPAQRRAAPMTSPHLVATEYAFGYKTGWLAVHADSHEQVVTALGLRRTEDVDWAEGVRRAYEEGVLVTPPVNGWVLAMGRDILVGPPDITRLSRVLDTEVQRFASHRVSDAYEWGRASSGALLRQILTTMQGSWTAEGEPTEVERQLGLETAESINDGPGLDEEIVLEIAGAWSIDPQLLDESMVDGRSAVWGLLP